MPCTKGMRDCVSSCGHRAMIEEYRLARYNEEQARDAITSMWATETLLHTDRHGPLLTFQQWLVGRTNPQPEVAAVVALPPVMDPTVAAEWAA